MLGMEITLTLFLILLTGNERGTSQKYAFVISLDSPSSSLHTWLYLTNKQQITKILLRVHRRKFFEVYKQWSHVGKNDMLLLFV